MHLYSIAFILLSLAVIVSGLSRNDHEVDLALSPGSLSQVEGGRRGLARGQRPTITLYKGRCARKWEQYTTGM